MVFFLGTTSPLYYSNDSTWCSLCVVFGTYLRTDSDFCCIHH